MSVKVQCVVLLFCVIEWSADAQFGAISISLGNDREGDPDQASSTSMEMKSECPPHTTCTPVSACGLLGDLLDVSCLSSDKYFHRLNALSCGSVGGEDGVCCPACDCARVYEAGAARCGRPMVRGGGGRGLGGQPWVARVGFTHKETGNVRFACSGSIISKYTVLTAAHCALAKPEGYKLSTVVVGDWDISRSPDCTELFCAPPAQAIRVDRVIVHPGYEQKIFRHDIALIVLQDEIQFSVAAAPICLNDSPETILSGRATLVGWGKLSGQTNAGSRQQQLEVPLLPLEACARVFGESVPVHEGQLCAGGEEGRDACSGFGGAPLLVEREGTFVQLGIVSFGSESCGGAGVPSVYTAVRHYRRWVEDNAPGREPSRSRSRN